MKELKTELLEPAERLGKVRRIFPWLTRAPELFWDPFSDMLPRSVKDSSQFSVLRICQFQNLNFIVSPGQE